MRPSCFLLLAVLAMSVVPASARAQDAEDQTVYVVSYIDAAFAAESQTAALLRELRDASRNDAGLIRFEVLQRTDPSNQFVILEVWENQEALDAHAAAPHARQFRERLAPHLIAPVDERLCVTTAVSPAHPGTGGVYVVTHVDVPPPFREKAFAALTVLAERSRKETGNTRFDVVHQEARTNHFTVIEVWRDEATNQAHELAAHTRAFREELTPMTGALYDQRWYAALD